ncbi:hypothetical protein KIL84_015940 [Mauremys mutica]|uniref:Uncharacterized protein n=1 Tax=Mauremys mutica TaxID=74926 RepID=A0A9D4AQ52_9SAUR|nr:hypothetical protein KIL84_015940 [Mauremys mutica]
MRNNLIMAASTHPGKNAFSLYDIDSTTERRLQSIEDRVLKMPSKNMEEYNKGFCAIFSDKENGMRRLRELLRCNHPKLLNFIEREVTSNAMLKHNVEIQTFFCSHKQLHNWLVERGGLTPDLSTTLSGTLHICCQLP